MGYRKYFLQAFIGVSLTMTLTLIYPAQAAAPTFHKVAVKKSISLAMTNPREYARLLLVRKGMGLQEYKCLINIGVMESHWNYKARNKSPVLQGGKWLHAYGIGQLITETSHDPAKQIRNWLRYIGYRYGSPCQAWQWWQRKYWY